MREVEVIEKAVANLTPPELAEFAAWFETHAAERFDAGFSRGESARLVRHFATAEFWRAYRRLPGHARDLADKSFALLKADPDHPSLHLKKIGRIWSVRVGLRYRALATEVEDGLLWFWIGSHADYEKMLRR
jgi:hypothetical protein